MHELHLAEDVVRKIQEKAKAEGLEKVSSAKIGLGQSRFTHLEELQELIAAVAKDTAAAGAKVEIEIIPVKTACAKCGKEFNPEKMRLDCPHCGSTDIRMASGNELIVKEIR
jgi:hydrogenase nickel incorporation protein HypA/HybF